jgi:hypothetical protein
VGAGSRDSKSAGSDARRVRAREIGHFVPLGRAVNGGPPFSSLQDVLEQNGLIVATEPSDGLWILSDMPR